jgi:hypothetical protein
MVKIADNQNNINIFVAKNSFNDGSSGKEWRHKWTAFTEGSVGKNLLKLIFW